MPTNPKAFMQLPLHSDKKAVIKRSLYDASGDQIAVICTPYRDERVAYLLRAVNSFEAMREALERIGRFAKDRIEDGHVSNWPYIEAEATVALKLADGEA